MSLDLNDLDNLRVLRLLSRYGQKRAAELAGVSVRTWRRWENGEAPTLVIRWMRYECGIVPGWPEGWRVTREGVEIPGIYRTINFGMIEGGGWAFGVLRKQNEQEAERAKQKQQAREAAAEAAAKPGSNVIPLHNNG